MKLDKYEEYAPLVLRIGISIVFLWFGFSQFKSPGSWTGMVPDYAVSLSHMSAKTLVNINGVIEIVLATLLLLGLYTRLASLLLTLHLLHITTILGYGAIAARDLALAIATFSIFLRGADEFCLDKIRKNKKEENISSVN